MAIALIDYRAGNLTSVRKGFAAVGAELFTPAAAADLSRATRHRRARRRTLRGDGISRRSVASRNTGGRRGRRAAARHLPWPAVAVRRKRRGAAARDWVRSRGTVREAPPTVKVPHVGWNSLEVTRPSPLLEGVPDGAQVYFTHSYAAPVTGDCVAATTHGTRFAAAVQRGHVWGVQFHPEKSSAAGLQILENFTRAGRRACSVSSRANR